MKTNTHKKTDRKTIFLWCGITLAWILFIWGHSLMPGQLSSAESNGVLAFLQPIFAKLNLSEFLSSLNIRKIAHFTEFFVLGFFLSVSIRKGFAKWPLPIDFCVLLIGTFVALCDESIQAFVPDRSCQITDVVIDFTGVFCAVLIVMLVKYVPLVFRKQK